MSDDGRISSGGGSGVMAFIVGGLVVAVGIIAYLMFGGGVELSSSGGESTTINVETKTSEPAGSGGSEYDAPASGSGGSSNTDQGSGTGQGTGSGQGSNSGG